MTASNMVSAAIVATLILVCILATASAASLRAPAVPDMVVPKANLQSAPYAPWAHHHWVWLSNPVSNQSSVLEFVHGFQERNITVGAVDIDSGWATGFNDFVVDTAKFPDAKGMVDTLHGMNINVILWATSMIDTNSPNYDYASNHSYFVKNALNEDSTLHWWHGNGQLLDYTNPEAVEWFHGQMDKALALGIDGWKTDGTDPFIMEYIVPHGKGGVVTYRDYADSYYGDFFNYTRKTNGEHCLIMARPVDSYPFLDGDISVYLDFAPRYTMFSGWVGDEDPTFYGLKNAMRNMIHSAWAGYPNFGSDIGGYRTGPGVLGRTRELFTRWFQMGAFVPLMENGGDKQHRPWAFDPPGTTEVTDLYRKFVEAHYELVPYLLTTGTEAFESGNSSMVPMQPAPKKKPWIVQINDIKDFGYLLGKQIFVQPVMEANVTTMTFATPAGGSWADFWSPSVVHPGGQNITVDTPLEYFPVFHKTGSLLPLNVTTASLGHGDGSHPGLTFVLNTPDTSGGVTSQDVREWQGTGVTASYWFEATNEAAGEGHLHFSVTATSHDISLALQRVQSTDATAMLLSNSPATLHTPAMSIVTLEPASALNLGPAPHGLTMTLRNIRVLPIQQ